jgi:hypothetical protein
MRGQGGWQCRRPSPQRGHTLARLPVCRRPYRVPTPASLARCHGVRDRPLRGSSSSASVEQVMGRRAASTPASALAIWALACVCSRSGPVCPVGAPLPAVSPNSPSAACACPKPWLVTAANTNGRQPHMNSPGSAGRPDRESRSSHRAPTARRRSPPWSDGRLRHAASPTSICPGSRTALLAGTA